MMRTLLLILLLAGVWVLLGCAGRPETKPITKHQYKETVIKEEGE